MKVTIHVYDDGRLERGAGSVRAFRLCAVYEDGRVVDPMLRLDDASVWEEARRRECDAIEEGHQVEVKKGRPKGLRR